MPLVSPNVTTGWAPLPSNIPGQDSSQMIALSAPVNSLLLTGGRGWGKTELQLMRFRSRVGMGYGTYWRGVIFDREYKNLDDLVVKSKRLFNENDFGHARFLSSNSDFKWIWDTGEELLFRAVANEDDYWAYHGHEYPFLGWNELTKYRDAKLYTKMLSVNRSGFEPLEHTPRLKNDIEAAQWTRARDGEGHLINQKFWNRPFNAGDFKTPNGEPLPPIPLETVSTTNPYGPGHNWVKAEFIDPAPYGRIIRKTRVIFNPKTQKDEEVTRTQMTVFGTFKDNPYLSPQYIMGLYEETDENILKAWLDGSWDIVAGGALDDKWKRSTHVVRRFAIPRGWYIDRALDWGSSHPFSVGWFAESNGEEINLPDVGLGQIKTYAFQPGTLIQIAEYYGSKLPGTNTGLKMGAKDIAKGIKKIEADLLAGGWIVGTVSPGPADNQIASVIEITTDTIEKMMADEGVLWEKSEKGKGSRISGLQLIRDRLEASTRQEGPGLVFMDNCVASIATIPVLPRDDKNPDDVDTDAEDHAYDMVRYRVLKGNNRFATVIKVNFGR